MLFPKFISVTQLLIETKGKKSLISTTFVASFGNGIEKMLNCKEWSLTSLQKDDVLSGEATCMPLFVGETPLYHLDWTNVPCFGNFKKHYPKKIV